jgi:hypothetical protein
MKLTDRLSIPDQVMAREVGDELVILDLASGSYFGLDPVGTSMWRLLAGGATLAETAEAMAGEYEVEQPRLEADLLALAERLVAQGLLAPTR